MRLDSTLCEPFRAWNRVEPRPRREDLTQALQARVHDPLWLLTRQWQFGEFQGEDTGSAVFAKLAVETSRPSLFQLGADPLESYAHDVPLEARVERQAFPWDLKTRVQAGAQWLKFLDEFGARFNAGNPTLPPYVATAYRTLFQEHFRLPDPDPDLTLAEGFIDHASLVANRPAHQFLALVSGRGGFDGVAVYLTIAANPAAVSWPAAIDQGIAPDHRNWLAEAAAAFRQWFDDLYDQPATMPPAGWNPQQLEYQCLCAVPEPDGTHTVLKAEEYYQGQLDWYAFDIDPNVRIDRSPQSENIETRILSVIPTEARFAGMPNPRWWEFEDGHIDLGNVQATDTDLAKSLLVEFALMYSNDWFLVPLRLPVGSLSEVQGIVVLDTFGQRTHIEAAGKADHEDWTGWNLFHLTQRPRAGELHNQVDSRLFLPPVVARRLESEQVEAVSFIRDEALNLVWAVETRVSDQLGQGQDGHTAGRQLRTLMEAQMDQAVGAVPSTPAAVAALSYRLSNTVPENWIPFLPVHRPGDNRAIQLQRGSMPRFLPEAVQPVRPKTTLLRPELKPYFLFEEEVGRAGVIVKGTYQRARWYHGETFTWYGYQKVIGRGEGSSGLQFDSIEYKKD